MINSSPHDEEPSIQESLLQLSTQLGQTLDQASIDRLCQTAEDLLRNVSPAPVTLARVAGTLLVYQKIGVRTSPFTGTFPTSLEKVDYLYDEHGITGTGGK
jgi:hypothetical protein